MLLGIIDMLAVNISGWHGPASPATPSPRNERHMRMRRRFGECARGRREPAGQSQYMEKKRKREENDQKQTGAQNSVRPFCRSQKTFFAQSFAQKETGSSLLHKNYFLPKALLRKKQALLSRNRARRLTRTALGSRLSSHESGCQTSRRSK